MNQFKNRWAWVLMLIAGMFGLSSRAEAAGYNCRSDKRFDVPMQFTATLQSAGHIHLSVYGGSDKSGWFAPYYSGAWRTYTAAGKEITRFSSSTMLFVSTDMLKETNLEGLIPGSYVIELVSQDLCGNLGTFRRSVTVPQAVVESNPPVISALDIVQFGALGASANQLHFSAADDTAIKHATVSINGNLIAEYKYFDGVGYRWWTEYFPDDNGLSVYEGPNWYIAYPQAYIGQYVVVEIIVEDMFGNQSRQSAQLYL
jgi:hypothetical protein